MGGAVIRESISIPSSCQSGHRRAHGVWPCRGGKAPSDDVVVTPALTQTPPPHQLWLSSIALRCGFPFALLHFDPSPCFLCIYLFSPAPGHSGRPQSIRPKDWEGLQRAQQEDGCGAGAGGVRGEEICFVTSCRGCSWVEILTFIAASWLTMSLFYVHGYVWSESKGMVIVAWFLKIPWPNKSRTIGLLRRMILRASCTYHTEPHGLVIGLSRFLAPRTLFLDLFLLVSMPLVKTRH